MELLSELSALGQIILIDVTLAGDNAIVVGMAAAGLPPVERHRAIAVGICAATVLRVVFALFTVQLLGIIGLMLAGGLLLLWVAWKMYRHLRAQAHHRREAAASTAGDTPPPSPEDGAIVEALDPHAHKNKTLREAVTQIVVADVSMSLDNVLGVAGAARDHMWVLILGLALSILLMGVASTFVVKLLHRYHWLGYAGLFVILYVALKMIWDGWHDIYEKVDFKSLANTLSGYLVT